MILENHSTCCIVEFNFHKNFINLILILISFMIKCKVLLFLWFFTTSLIINFFIDGEWKFLLLDIILLYVKLLVLNFQYPSYLGIYRYYEFDNDPWKSCQNSNEKIIKMINQLERSSYIRETY